MLQRFEHNKTLHNHSVKCHSALLCLVLSWNLNEDNLKWLFKLDLSSHPLRWLICKSISTSKLLSLYNTIIETIFT
jgi:hypothetical protein